MTNFFTAIVGFALFFVVFYGATKLMGYAFRKSRKQEETASIGEDDGIANDTD